MCVSQLSCNIYQDRERNNVLLVWHNSMIIDSWWCNWTPQSVHFWNK